MDDMKLRILPGRRTHGSQCHQMLAADHKGKFFILQDGLCCFFNLRKNKLRISYGKLQISQIKDPAVLKVSVLIRTVCFQPVRIIPYRLSCESRSRTEGSGGIKRRPVKHNVRFLISGITANKVHY